MKNIYNLLIVLTLIQCSTEEKELPQSTHPVWSPDGSQIAFINNAAGLADNNGVNFEVFTMNSDGSNIKQHTNNTAFEAEISWFEDGSKLAFKSYRDENDEVYILDLTSGEQQNISNSPSRDGGPFWSGDSLFFQSDRDHEKGELYSYLRDTKVTTRLTNNDFNEIGAVWSPDGQFIAFVSDMDGDDDIYVMISSGVDVVQLTNNELNDWYPQWSPDGESILFTYGDWNTDIWELRVINKDGSDEKTIIKQTDSGNASWHPDGKRIAFASSKTGPGEVYVFDLDTGKERQITSSK